MHNGPYVTVTECATRRRYVGKFHLSCSECGLLSSHARPRGSSACHLCKCNKNFLCKQVAVTACTTLGLCLSVLQPKANVNGECKCRTLHERPVASSTCPLPIPKRTCSGCGTMKRNGVSSVVACCLLPIPQRICSGCGLLSLLIRSRP